MLSRQLGGTGGGIVIPLRLEDVEPPILLRSLQSMNLFPNFDAGVASLVGFLLSETQPVVLVQQEMKGRRSVAELTSHAFSPGRAVTPAEQFSFPTRRAWHGAMGDEPLTDAVLGKLDNRTIRRTALRCLERQHVMAFCIDNETDFGGIGGNTLNELVLSLLLRLLSDGDLEGFLRWLAQERPRCVREAIRLYMPEVLTS